MSVEAVPAGTQPATELPVSPRVYGQPMHELPEDLYIPPDALEVFLEAFEGPLDLLLYLIRRQNIDILDIPVADITRQYMLYVELMQATRLELAAEYLLMAAMLAEIKSRMLLPRLPAAGEEDEEDPRADLVRRLQEYERYRQAAEDLDALPRLDRELWVPELPAPAAQVRLLHPPVSLDELLQAMADVLRQARFHEHHQISRETLSTRERMSQLLERLADGHFHPFVSLFSPEEGRAGVVVTFMAMLELIKEGLLDLVQNDPLSPIHVRLRSQDAAPAPHVEPAP